MFPSIGKHSSRIDHQEKLNALSNIAKNCTKFVDNDYIPIYSCHMPTETGLLGICSFVLTMTNIICIIGKLGSFQMLCIIYLSSLSRRNGYLTNKRSGAYYA
jgi:hypothetical protein